MSGTGENDNLVSDAASKKKKTKTRWLNRKDRGALVGISPLVFDQGPSVREKPQIILETKLGD